MPKALLTPDSKDPEGTRAEEKLRAHEALLAQAEQLANIGSWEVNLEKDTVTWSAHFYQMLGREPEKGPVPHGRVRDIIHPDDLGRATRDMAELRANGVPLDHELRYITSSGDVRIFHSRAVRITDASGRVVRVCGMSQDVTESKNKDELLRRSEALLSQAEEMANFGSWERDLVTGTVGSVETAAEDVRPQAG